MADYRRHRTAQKGKHSVGVAPQIASELGKRANCQTLVSVTLTSNEVPVMVGLRLFLPESWTSDFARLDRAGVPNDVSDYRTKPEIALVEIDRVRAAGVCYGCVLADAGYGYLEKPRIVPGDLIHCPCDLGGGCEFGEKRVIGTLTSGTFG